MMCRHGAALGWFTGALDAELRAALRRRFELRRAEYDAPLGERAARGEGSTSAATPSRGGWSAVPIPPDAVDTVLAGLQRGIRNREPFRPGPVRAPRVGRNDPCPCGSGRKYKRCCLGSA